ncbi:hypothetical protein J6590_033794 [Homalodisca vitripennis]|nr:hypothetical protein J6590_033794 [Homalodisca vitripennis]
MAAAALYFPEKLVPQSDVTFCTVRAHLDVRDFSSLTFLLAAQKVNSSAVCSDVNDISGITPEEETYAAHNSWLTVTERQPSVRRATADAASQYAYLEKMLCLCATIIRRQLGVGRRTSPQTNICLVCSRMFCDIVLED